MESPVPSSPAPTPDEMNSFFKGVLDNLFDGVYFTDRQRRITYWNQAAEQLTGYRAEEVLGTRCADNILMHVDGVGRLLCTGECPLSRAMADSRPRREEVYLHHKDGHRVPVEVRVSPIRGKDGEVVGAVEVFNDNSRQRAVRERARELAKLAFLDPASEVANRRYLEQQLSQQFHQHSEFGIPFGIMLADLDELKQINDTYGHGAGDAALFTVARTLSGCVRASDVLGRWGGDEFLAILAGITEEILTETSARCKALVAQTMVPVAGSQIQVSISVGTAIVAPGDSRESLLSRADQNLYRCKHSSRNRVSGS
jgi:diguanylate cyclase (GGDEF)-like protein/PAS domain S-box-containing protein